jgi:hypothetical protein
MSTVGNWRGANIVKQGLVLYLDPGSPNSYYNKTNTTIRDISGNGYDGTLTNFGSQTIYNSGSGGNIVFDGSDDYINMGDRDAFTQASGFTFEVYFNPTTLNSNTIIQKYQATETNIEEEYIFGFTGNRLYGWVYDNSLGGIRGRSIQNVSSYMSTNQWCNLVFTYDGGTTSSSCKLYINAVQRDDTNFESGTFTSIRNTATPLNIALTNGGLGAPIKGSMGTLRMYNRALTAQEVLQNFNATKSRFSDFWNDGFTWDDNTVWIDNY